MISIAIVKYTHSSDSSMRTPDLLIFISFDEKQIWLLCIPALWAVSKRYNSICYIFFELETLRSVLVVSNQIKRTSFGNIL